MADFVRFTTSSGGNPEQALVELFGNILPSPEQMVRSADNQIQRIKERTSEGRDVNGAPFTPYSPQYSKSRVKRGLSVSPVDLRASGRMLDAMESEVRSESSFAIVINDSEAAAYASAVNERRRFFDTSKDELQEMLVDLRT